MDNRYKILKVGTAIRFTPWDKDRGRKPPVVYGDLHLVTKTYDNGDYITDKSRGIGPSSRGYVFSVYRPFIVVLPDRGAKETLPELLIENGEIVTT